MYEVKPAMLRAINRDFLLWSCLAGFILWAFTPVFAQNDEVQEAPPGPAVAISTIEFSGNTPVSLVVARPTDNSKSYDVDNSWISAFCHEFLLFRFGAIGRFKVEDPDSVGLQIRKYNSYNNEPLPKQTYISYAKKINVPYILCLEFAIDNAVKKIHFNLSLESIGNDEKALSSASCDVEKIDKGLDLCVREVINLCTPAPESYTLKFLKTKIVGSLKSAKLIGASRIAAYKSDKKHLKFAEDLKKISTHEQSFLAQYVGAREFAKAGQYEDAALLLKDLIFNLGPCYPHLYALTAKNFRMAKKYEDALQMVKVCEGLNLQTNDLILEKALVLEARNEWNDAESAYREVLTFDPNNYNALIFLMRKSNRDKQADEALNLAAAFERQYPEDGRECLEKGKALMTLNQRKNARSSLNRALALMPDNGEAHLLLAELLMQEGDFNGALSHYAKLMKLTPDNVDVYIKAAHAYTLQANPGAALETLQKIATRYYDNPVVQREVGLAEFQTGDTAKAKRDLSRYLQNWEPDLKVLVILGRIHSDLGEYEEALEMFEKAYPLDNNEPAARQRIEAVKARLLAQGPSRKAKSPFEDMELKKPKKKFPVELTVKIASGGLAAIGFVGGYLINQKINEEELEYHATHNTPRANELGDLMRKNEKLRNALYLMGFGSGTLFGVSFFVPIPWWK
jgi:tetratricopeptide (TPR) repeat protein